MKKEEEHDESSDYEDASYAGSSPLMSPLPIK